MALNESLFKRLAETPGIPGREEQVRALVHEEPAPLVDAIDRPDAPLNGTSIRACPP